jgi:hypothetical protein
MAASPHGFQQVERAKDVDARVGHRIDHALADVDLRGKVAEDVEAAFANNPGGFVGPDVRLMKDRAPGHVFAPA